MYQGLLFKIINKIRELSGNFILHELAGNHVFFNWHSSNLNKELNQILIYYLFLIYFIYFIYLYLQLVQCSKITK